MSCEEEKTKIPPEMCARLVTTNNKRVTFVFKQNKICLYLLEKLLMPNTYFAFVAYGVPFPAAVQI